MRESLIEVHIGLASFVLALAFLENLLALEESLAVLVHLECSDSAVGWVDGDLHLLSAAFLVRQFVDVQAPALSVHLENLALLGFIVPCSLERLTYRA